MRYSLYYTRKCTGRRAAKHIWRRAWFIFCTVTLLTLIAGKVNAEEFITARYKDPVNRYGHFALGKPHEYAAVAATTQSGRILHFRLPRELVFEDLEPRIISLAAGDKTQLLTIVSGRDGGARLMLLKREGDRLVPSAQSAPIGTPMRWLNPVGAADLDGDGQTEIAAVITPHIGGILKVFRKVGNHLVEIAALGDFSNHVFSSEILGLSAVTQIKGRMILVVPDSKRKRLRLVALANRQLIEVGSCALERPLKNALKLHRHGSIEISGSLQPRLINLENCGL